MCENREQSVSNNGDAFHVQFSKYILSRNETNDPAELITNTGILKNQNVSPECLQCTVWLLQSATKFLDPNISNTVGTEIHIFQF